MSKGMLSIAEPQSLPSIRNTKKGLHSNPCSTLQWRAIARNGCFDYQSTASARSIFKAKNLACARDARSPRRLSANSSRNSDSVKTAKACALLWNLLASASLAIIASRSTYSACKFRRKLLTLPRASASNMASVRSSNTSSSGYALPYSCVSVIRLSTVGCNRWSSTRRCADNTARCTFGSSVVLPCSKPRRSGAVWRQSAPSTSNAPGQKNCSESIAMACFCRSRSTGVNGSVAPA